MYSLWKQLLNVCVICKLNYYSVPSKPIKFSSSAAYSIVVMSPPPPPLSSRSGSATVYCTYMQVTEFFSTQKSMDQLCDLSVG